MNIAKKGRNAWSSDMLGSISNVFLQHIPTHSIFDHNVFFFSFVFFYLKDLTVRTLTLKRQLPMKKFLVKETKGILSSHYLIYVLRIVNTKIFQNYIRKTAKQCTLSTASSSPVLVTSTTFTISGAKAE